MTNRADTASTPNSLVQNSFRDFDANEHALIICDSLGDIHFSNEKVSELLGWTPGMLVMDSVQRLFSFNRLADVVQWLRHVLASATNATEQERIYNLEKSDHSIERCLVRIVPTVIDNEERIIMSIWPASATDESEERNEEKSSGDEEKVEASASTSEAKKTSPSGRLTKKKKVTRRRAKVAASGDTATATDASGANGGDEVDDSVLRTAALMANTLLTPTLIVGPNQTVLGGNIAALKFFKEKKVQCDKSFDTISVDGDDLKICVTNGDRRETVLRLYANGGAEANAVRVRARLLSVRSRASQSLAHDGVHLVSFVDANSDTNLPSFSSLRRPKRASALVKVRPAGSVLEAFMRSILATTYLNKRESQSAGSGSGGASPSLSPSASFQSLSSAPKRRYRSSGRSGSRTSSPNAFRNATMLNPMAAANMAGAAAYSPNAAARPRRPQFFSSRPYYSK